MRDGPKAAPPTPRLRRPHRSERKCDPRTVLRWMSFRPDRTRQSRTRNRDITAVIVAFAILGVALTACGSSSGGSTSHRAEAPTTKPVTSETEAAPSETEAATEESGGAAELESIIKL